jgi:hypothetical protein
MKRRRIVERVEVKAVTMTMVMSAMMKRAMTRRMMVVTSNPRLWPAGGS